MLSRSHYSSFLLDESFNFLDKFFFKRNYITPLLFVVGFISGLKIGLTAFLPIVTITLAFLSLLLSRNSYAISLYIASLFLIVNYSDSITTPLFIRYLIYISGVSALFLFNSKKINYKNILMFSCLLIIVSFSTFLSTFIHYIEFNASTFFRDIVVLFILLMLCFQKKKVDINTQLIFALLVGVLFGEIVLLLFRDNLAYFNLSSTKAFIIFVPYYLFAKKKYFLGAFSFFCCLLVIANYGTRMILLSLIFFSLAGSIIYLLRKRNIKLFTIFAFSIITIFFGLQFLFSIEYFTGFKALSFLSIFYSLGDYGILEIAKILDAVRYAEHQIFFSRSIPEILFGNGLGSGIYDINSYLGFVNYWQSAFSQEEIQSNYFYNLHDYWIDFGLRFGLLSVLIVLYLVSIGQMLKGNIFYGIMMGCLLINVTYSGSGIILVALMHKFYRHNFEQQQ